MAPPADRIFTTCQALLDAVVTYHGGSLPARQYVSAGPPAFDCELVAVRCDRTYGYEGDATVEAVPIISRSAGFAMRAGTFVVTIARCTPAVPDHKGSKPKPPTTDQEEAAASALYEDAQRMLNALVTASKVGELSGCHGIWFREWVVIGPEGGYVAGELSVAVGLVIGA
jgi:hypothetical protein